MILSVTGRDDPQAYYTEHGTRIIDRMIHSIETLTGLEGVLFFKEKKRERNAFLLKRMGHKNPYCGIMKGLRFETCIQCCNQRRDQRAKIRLRPFIDECDFGVVELVIPLLKDDQLLSTISFGQVRRYQSRESSVKYLQEKTFAAGLNISIDELYKGSKHFIYYSPDKLLRQGELFFFAFSHAVSILNDSATEEALKIRSNPIIHQAVNYLQSCDREFPSQGELAETLGINREYFSRLFRKTLEKGYVRYLNELRISRAQQLLKNTYLSITEIAGEVGFSRHSYFSQLFKELTNLQPSQYRNSHRRFGEKEENSTD